MCTRWDTGAQVCQFAARANQSGSGRCGIISTMRRVLRVLSVALITAGCVILLDAGVTLAWKEPVSALYAELLQDQARAQLQDLSSSFEADPDVAEIEKITSPERRAGRLADLFEEELETGEGIGEISAVAAGIDYVVVEGTETATLEKGPGRYPETALPGQGKTIGIAGHRTTYGAPFRNIDRFKEGDEIEVEMPYGIFTYEVEKMRIVEPTATEIVRDVGRERLVLTACHPLYSADQRYAVFGQLVDVSSAGGPDSEAARAR